MTQNEAYFPLVYDELRQLARRYMNQEYGYRTLQPTALVNEAYIKLSQLKRVEWQSREHFFAFAATQMRRILVDHARARGRDKRGGNGNRVTLHDGLAINRSNDIDLLHLDIELTRLAERHPRQARVAELRFFSGLLITEISEVLEVSPRTVTNDWKVAKAWIAMRLRDTPQ